MQFFDNGEEQVVVGTLDLNQCLRMTDELTGKRPEVCVLANFVSVY